MVVWISEGHTVLFYSETSDISIKDTPKEDKPPNKGQAESTLVYTLYIKSPLKEDNLSTKDKTAGPEGVLIKRFHCIGQYPKPISIMIISCSLG